ncbi:MAG TPA: TolC family protein [Saprospiraceae bacterium]|nr:TolC family protein [Saprospiraceae bacterium]
MNNSSKLTNSFKWFLAFLCNLALYGTSLGQSLDYTAFRQQVLQFHPLIRQADLQQEQARAALLRARGGFDPKIFAEQSGKTFNGKTYFQYTEAGLKYPTWAGLELKGSYNLASGNFINSESALPEAGQALFGLNWTLGQGLLFDERRASLEMANIGLNMGAAERLAARNELMYEAAKAYWTWTYAQNAVNIVTDALKQAKVRHEALRQSFFQGERSAVDTLETFIQVQTREVDLQFALNDAQNAALGLGVFWWTENGNQALPAGLAAPELWTQTGSQLQPTQDLLRSALASHPELQIYRAKLQQLTVERKLKREKLKPILDVNYNLLGNGWSFFPTATAEGPAVLANDVKWGVQFSYPILNRKARGDWQVTRIKIAQTDLEIQQKQQSITAKVQQYGNDLENLRAQTDLFRNMAANYRTLLDAENVRFSIGESSVFLVNTREQRWLDAQLKYLKLLSEWKKAEAGLQWSAGVLGE